MDGLVSPEPWMAGGDRVRLPSGNVLVSRPAEERGLKPSLATTTAKASERVIADPLAWEREGGSLTKPGTQCHTSATFISAD